MMRWSKVRLRPKRASGTRVSFLTTGFLTMRPTPKMALSGGRTMGVKKSISANPRLVIVNVPWRRSSGESRFSLSFLIRSAISQSMSRMVFAIRCSHNRHDERIVSPPWQGRCGFASTPESCRFHARVDFRMKAKSHGCGFTRIALKDTLVPVSGQAVSESDQGFCGSLCVNRELSGLAQALEHVVKDDFPDSTDGNGLADILSRSGPRLCKFFDPFRCELCFLLESAKDVGSDNPPAGPVPFMAERSRLCSAAMARAKGEDLK